MTMATVTVTERNGDRKGHSDSDDAKREDQQGRRLQHATSLRQHWLEKEICSERRLPQKQRRVGLRSRATPRDNRCNIDAVARAPQ